MQLLYRRIVCICLLKIRGESVPDKAFCDRSRATPAPSRLSEADIFDPIFPNSAGMEPVSQLLLTFTYIQFPKHPREDGMVPVNLLELILICKRAVV